MNKDMKMYRVGMLVESGGNYKSQHIAEGDKMIITEEIRDGHFNVRVLSGEAKGEIVGYHEDNFRLSKDACGKCNSSCRSDSGKCGLYSEETQ